jgi:hypothetical protein
VNLVPNWTYRDSAQQSFRKKDLHIRDLRLLSPVSNGSLRPVIAVRKQAIVLKLEHVRAVILHDSVFLMGDFEGTLALTEELLSTFKDRLCTYCTQQPDQSLELYVLEVLLESVHDSLDHEIGKLKQDAESLRDKRTKRNETQTMDEMRRVLSQIGGLIQRGEEVCNVLTNVLDDPDDLGMMRLSRMTAVERVELLLQKSWQAISNVNHEIMQVMGELDEEQCAFEQHLAFFSNRFVWSSFTFRIVNLVFTFGAMWTAILGMNISVGFDGDGWDPEEEKTFLWRKADSVFASTTIALCAGCFCLCLLTLWCVSRAYVG